MMDFSKLLEPQREHAVRLLDSIYENGVAADLSETGCGKTYVSAWIAKNLGVKPIVICPKVMRQTWRRVLASQGVVASTIINYEKLFRGNTEFVKYDKKEFLLKKNWESKGLSFNFPRDSFVIMDEFHRCRGKDSLNGTGLIGLKNAKYKLLTLSATAASNPTEMRSIGYTLNLHKGDDFRKFCKEFGAYYRDGGCGTMDFDGETAEGKHGMQKMHDILFNQKKIASRMTRKQFGSIFPVNRIFAEPFDMGSNTAKINEVYRRMEYELALLDERSANYSAHVFAIIMEARRRTELLKVPAIAAQMEEMYDEGISPVVFLNFTDSIQGVRRLIGEGKRFKNKLCIIDGQHVDDVRQRMIDDFQSDKLRGVIAQTDAGGVGIGLHDLNGNFPRHSIVSPGWSAIMMLQALGRTHRAEAKTPTIQKILIAADTIEEERIAPRVQGKLDNMDMLNDGDLQQLVKLN